MLKCFRLLQPNLHAPVVRQRSPDSEEERWEPLFREAVTASEQSGDAGSAAEKVLYVGASSKLCGNAHIPAYHRESNRFHCARCSIDLQRILPPTYEKAGGK